MTRTSQRAAVALALTATAVLVAGVSSAAGWTGGPSPQAGAPSLPVAAPTAAPVAVRLAVQRPAPVRPALHPGDPATWDNRRLAAQLVFSCVQASDVRTARAHVAAGLGGVVMMGRPTDGPALTATLAGLRRTAPLGISPVLASDEEGGRVQRLRELLGPLPSAAVMGTWADPRIEQTARAYGARMRALGLHMALSPVADLAVPGAYPAATGRSFSADPRRAAGAAAAWARGLRSAGVVPAVKHWPGHGSAGDSHATAPTVPPLSVLQGRDLLPFDAVLRGGGGVVMVGHLRSPGLTEPGLPATLSPNAMRVLRSKVGPATVVLTDSVSMAASSSAVGLTPPQAALRALQAGADWAMSCSDPLGAVSRVHQALSLRQYPRAAAVASARRVLALKQRSGLLRTALAGQPPTGALEAAELSGGVLRLSGTADDPDGAAPPPLEVSVDGVVAHRSAAAASGRFAVSLPVAGPARVCLQARGTGRERPVPMGCVAVPRTGPGRHVK